MICYDNEMAKSFNSHLETFFCKVEEFKTVKKLEIFMDCYSTKIY